MKSYLWKIFAIAIVAVLNASPAQAQATRTWVSGVGDDVNPCSRTAPCKTFAGAISKTATSGEINCIDPGGFGAVTITKSITIDCGGTFGSILNSLTNGIIINAAPPANVTIRNLSIDGAGNGINGIRILAGDTVLIENVQIFGNSGQGIDVEPASGTAKVIIKDATVHNNPNGGILLRPAAGAFVNALLTQVNMYNNLFGLRAEERSKATVFRSTAASNTNNGILAVSSSAVVQINVFNTAISHNEGSGVATVGAAATIRLQNSAILGNGIGINASGGGVIAGTTPDTNSSAGNATDGAVNASVNLQ